MNRVQKAIVQAVEDAEVRSRLTSAGYEMVATTPAAMGQAIKRQSQTWEQIIKAAGIEPQ